MASNATFPSLYFLSDGVDNEKATDADEKKVIESGNDQKITDASFTVAADAPSRQGEENCHIVKHFSLSISACTSLQ